MADMDEEYPDHGDAGSENTELVKGSGLKKGNYCIVKGHPCKITEQSTSKTGKHGSAKVHITGTDLFTNKKYEQIFCSTHDVKCPIVNRKEYNLIDVTDDGYACVMDDNGACREDLIVPKGDLGTKIDEYLKLYADSGCVVTVICAMNQELIIDVKQARS